MDPTVVEQELLFYLPTFLQPVIVNRDLSFISVIHLLYFSYILARSLQEEPWDTITEYKLYRNAPFNIFCSA